MDNEWTDTEIILLLYITLYYFIYHFYYFFVAQNHKAMRTKH